MEEERGRSAQVMNGARYYHYEKGVYEEGRGVRAGRQMGDDTRATRSNTR